MLLDTSGLLCLLHKAEPFHDKACQSYHAGQTRFTHNYILAEFVALGIARRFPQQTALSFVIDLLKNPDVDTVWIDEVLHHQAMSLLLERPGKNYSLCDAASFILMRQRNVQDALTTDRHFEQG